MYYKSSDSDEVVNLHAAVFFGDFHVKVYYYKWFVYNLM